MQYLYKVSCQLREDNSSVCWFYKTAEQASVKYNNLKEKTSIVKNVRMSLVKDNGQRVEQ